MVSAWLAGDLSSLLGRNPHARVILWFDKENEFSRLLDAGALDGAPFRLIRYQVDPANGVFHGAFWVKAQIEWEPRDLPQEERDALRFVVHIPMKREALDDPQDATELSLECLLEYKHSGKIWLVDGDPPTVFNFLKSHGVALPTTRAEQHELRQGGADSLLARFVSRFRDRDAAFWQQPLNAQRIRGLVLGILDDELLALLADPVRGATCLQERELLDVFTQSIESEFGFSAGLADDPEQWAGKFTLRLAMTECFEAYGRPDDFPYKALLPPEPLRPRHLAFLKRWMSDHDVAEVFALRMPSLEGTHDLRTWAQERTGESVSFLSLAQVKWDEFHEGLKAVSGSRPESAQYLAERAKTVATNSESFWARRTKRLPGWAIAGQLSHLLALADEAVRCSAMLADPQDFVDRYASRWHDVDGTYWELSADLRAAVGIDTLQEVADRAYRHYLEATNAAFRKALNGMQDWQQWGQALVTNRADVLWSGSGRRAILVVDGLRYDLAERLVRRRQSGDVTLEPWVAAVPPTTGVGMTALLPGDLGGITAVVASGHLCLPHPEFGDLTLKDSRRKLLQARVPDTDTMDLNELATRKQAPKAEMLVVFAGDIDSVGHGIGTEVVLHIETLLSSVDTGISRLQGWRYTDIHIVTDHGFVLCPGGAEKDEFPSGDAIVKDKRHVFLKDGAVTSRPMLPFPFDARQRLVFAEGIRSFTAGEEYIHGGLSMQEVVIPHVCVKTEAVRPKLMVRLEQAPQAITQNPLSLYVVTSGPQQATLGFEEPLPRNVHFDLRRDPAEASSSVCMQSKTEQFTLEDQGSPRRVTLFLDHDKTPSKGEKLHLHMRDADNDAEDLAPGISFTLADDI